MRKAIKVFVLLIVLSCSISVFGLKLNLTERIKIPKEPPPLTLPLSFCVTEDGIFLIPDFDEGTIEIYENENGSLKLINIIGQKGYGKDQFINPAYCFYNNEEQKFGVIDYGIRKIFIYDRQGRINFVRVHEVPCPNLATAIDLKGNKLFVAGYKTGPNNTPYELYYIELPQNSDDNYNNITFLLDSNKKYGFKTPEEFAGGIGDKIEIGINSWIDVQGDNVFFNWEGNYTITNIDIKSSKILNQFGKKPIGYEQPIATNDMRTSRRNSDIETTKNKRLEKSYVINTFAVPNGVLVIYEGPGKSNLKMQRYDLSGKLINEVDIPEQPGGKMYVNVVNKTTYLYFLFKADDSGDYFISKYKIF